MGLHEFAWAHNSWISPLSISLNFFARALVTSPIGTWMRSFEAVPWSPSVRLPELPIEYYEPSALQEIGEAIGPLLRIHTHTTEESRGRFARLCVHVNFNEPITKLLKIGEIDQPVKYEGITSLCFTCGWVGHKAEQCHYQVRSPVREEGVCEAKKSDARKCQEEQSQASLEVAIDAFGPWVLVTRKKHPSRKGLKDNA